MSDNLFNNAFGLLTSDSPRMQKVSDFLLNDVWTDHRFMNNQAAKYFEDGEKQVLFLEDLIASSAFGFYDELTSLAKQKNNILSELNNPKTSMVVLDGCSLRELPVLKQIAEQTGYKINESGYRISSLPSDTLSFVEQRVVGKRVAPSDIESRKELKESNIKALYYNSPVRSFELPDTNNSYLLWSSFPDGTYMDYEAKNSYHFDNLIKQFDVIWKNIILRIPKDHRVIITSDHGYIYLNSGFESACKGDEALKFLQQNRYRIYLDNEIPPELPELQVIPDRKLAMLRGRIKNRPQGQSASKVFRHGGLSLMEMLVPWLVIEKKL